MKIIALDVGDYWTGVALSDPSGMLARPYDTTKTSDLVPFLTTLIEKEKITTVIVGLPITLRGTESEQTIKVKNITKMLEEQFNAVKWISWDERLTSKQATRLKPTRSKEEKIRSHAIAAALILTSYLEYKRLHTNQ